MNRIIKFRAWDKIGKQWIINRIVMGRILGDDFPPTWELSEFTGLLDKNGKEIWEGDILDIPEYHRQGIVEFFNGRFILRLHKTWDYGVIKMVGFACYQKHCEVIGNRFENPDLLFPSQNPKKGVK